MMDWNVIYRELTSKYNYIMPNPPATEKKKRVGIYCRVVRKVLIS